MVDREASPTAGFIFAPPFDLEGSISHLQHISEMGWNLFLSDHPGAVSARLVAVSARTSSGGLVLIKVWMLSNRGDHASSVEEIAPLAVREEELRDRHSVPFTIHCPVLLP